MLKLCLGYAQIIFSMGSADFDGAGVGVGVAHSGSLPSAEHFPRGRAPRGSVIHLRDERLNQPRQGWICLLCGMRFSKANYRRLAGGKGKYPFPSSARLVEGLHVCRQLSPPQLTQGKEVCERSLILSSTPS